MSKANYAIFKKIARILLWCVGIIVALLLLLIVLIQVPSVQNFAKDKAITFLQDKIKTKVALEHIAIKFPKKIVLEGFYFEDQQKDTLLSGKRLEVDIDLFKILNHQIEINSVLLENTTANISRNKDSIFNFDYIIKAFESPEKQPVDTTSTPYVISVVKVDLKNIKFGFKDVLAKNDIHLKLNEFSTKFKKFDLDAMDFNVPTIQLNGFQLAMNQDLVEKIAETSVKTIDTISKTPDFKIQLNTVELSQIKILYDNKDSKMNSGLDLGSLKLAVNAIDMKKQAIDLKSFEVKNLKGNLLLGKSDKEIKTPKLDTTSIPQQGWKVKLQTVDLQNIAFRYDDMQSKKTPKGLDYAHLDLKNFNTKMERLYYGNDTISGKINSLKVQEKSGLNVQSFRTDFFYGPKKAFLKELYLKTPRTLLKDEVQLEYASLDALSKNIGETVIDANLKQTKIGFQDILLLAPNLQNTNPFNSYPNAILSVNSKLKGKIKNLSIPILEVQGLGTTRIKVSGTVAGLPDVDKMFLDVAIQQFSSTAKDINAFVPKGTLPNSIQLPSQFNLNGKFKGTVTNFKTNLNLKSSFGSAKVDALFDQRVKNREKYDAAVVFTNFDLGKLIKNDSIGKISVKAKVKGTSLDPKTANAKLNAVVQQAVFNRYTYSNITLDGAIANGNFDVKSNSSDPNIAFVMSASGGFEDKFPAVKLKLNLDIADLEKLHLHAGPLKLRGNIIADFSNTNPDFLNGKLTASNIQILKEAEPIVLDSIKLLAFSDAEQNNIQISSQFLKAEMKGKYKLTTLSDAIQETVSKYINLNVTDKKAAKISDEQYFTVTAKVDNDPIIFQLIPDLTSLEPMNLEAAFDSKTDSLSLNANIPRLVYAGNTIAGVTANVATKENTIDYALKIGTIQNEQFKLPNTSLTGSASDNELDYALQILDDAQKERYFIAGKLAANEGQNTFTIDIEKLLLNYDNWKINPDNTIAFGNKGFYINNFELSNEGDFLKIQSDAQVKDSPLNIEFSNFKIATILSIVQKEDILAEGLINGTARIENSTTQPVFTSDLNINQFAFMGEPVGDLSIKVDNQTADTLSANVVLSGEGNDVKLAGTYGLGAGNLNLNLDLNTLNIKSIQGFTMGNITEGTGKLSGSFDVTGTVDAPKVNGSLQFSEAGFRVTQLNSFFKIKDETIALNNESIQFDSFTLEDENSNDLILDGNIKTSNFTDYSFGLTLTADNFRAVNSKAKDSDLFYGDLFLDAKLNVKGTLDSPEVDGKITIDKETEFTVVMPQSDPSIADREGIVEFVDEDNAYLRQTEKMQTELNQSELLGMDVNVAIAIDKEAKLTLLIDKGNGDYLELKGEAQLTGGIDPSGKTTLTGKYTFDEGAYEMNFNMLHRKFDIQKGSYIIWNGEPTEATLNITAVYEVETAPIDLVGNQLPTDSPTIRNTYKQKIPFKTILKMNGDLMKPDISFDIQLPDGNYGVSSDVVTLSQGKLEELRQDPNEMNKQVFALLLLNRFVGENPFESESGGANAETIARQSVSKILSEQLNNLAGDLIKGVQLEFDLESTEDYTSGTREERTDLNVGLSKKLLNDRLKVTVGSSFGLEGAQRNNEQNTNIAGDVALDYQLTADGRYMVRAYRKNEYQVAVEGQVIETGVAFIITMSYNKFRELFHRSEEEKRIIREQKEFKEKKKLEEEANKETIQKT
ncbi:translocation/assembly module TamB domain-containing protein [Flavobacterium agrisoli]|uniref:Translocation/assembly module TamB n=1 Tax=Flavobacterium agrisoli TaxID=2793066 RepID=A0A934UKH2_9FLAO|nr:translocation/assembly module TamB [Flavobacterium agrisoli]MBK0370440.1 translocation/assembly module TamB [Flavobacterium agrisoli]